MQWLSLILILPYLLLLFRIYTNLRKISIDVTITNPVTPVSVVVACRNEEDNLPHLLNKISKQNYPKTLFEIIIVDDNSTDRTFEIASSYKEIFKVSVLKNSGNGKKSALRTGILASSGTLIITTDADCSMGSCWISSFAAFYERKRPDMIIGPVQLAPERGFFGRFQELEFLSLQGITAGSANGGSAVMCNGANLAFTKEAYIRNQGNLHPETASGDDVFLLHSLKEETDSKIFWLESADALITTLQSGTIARFLRQRSRWISKGKYYSDKLTIVLAVVTFITICVQVSLLIAALIIPSAIWIFTLFFVLKSFPDYLIIRNRAERYGRKKILCWFLPAQVFYPFYIIGVAIVSIKKSLSFRINSPFLRGT